MEKMRLHVEVFGQRGEQAGLGEILLSVGPCRRSVIYDSRSASTLSLPREEPSRPISCFPQWLPYRTLPERPSPRKGLALSSPPPNNLFSQARWIHRASPPPVSLKLSDSWLFNAFQAGCP